MSKLDEIKDRLERASKQWGPYDANIPFYAVVRKPRPSLSKLDSRESYWNIDDAIFIANAREDIEWLIEQLKEKGDDTFRV